MIHAYPWQWKMLTNRTRFKVVVAGRRSGKTHYAATEVVEECKQPNRNIMIVAPTLGTVKDLYWDLLLKLIPDVLIAKKTLSPIEIRLINGTIIRLRGADSERSLRGYSNNLVILDETQSVGDKVWPQLLRPTLSDRRGRGIIIGTSLGRNHFYDLWYKGAAENPDKLKNWYSIQLTAYEAGVMAPSEIEDSKKELSAGVFALEYLASWDSGVGLVYSDFNRELNRSTKELDVNRPLLLGIDFNIGPSMACVVAQMYGEELHFVDEIVSTNPNFDTEDLAVEITQRYKRWAGRIEAFPDATNGRRTSSKTTDHAILEDYGIRVTTNNSNPLIRDRVNTVNSRICNALGERRIFIHPNCIKMLKCLEGQIYNKKGEPSKEDGHDHSNDALGYLVCKLFPMSRQSVSQRSIR